MITCEHSLDWRKIGGSRTWDFCECRRCGVSVSRTEVVFARINDGTKTLEEVVRILMDVNVKVGEVRPAASFFER